MRKILLLLLSIGFFAKPMLAQDDCPNRPGPPEISIVPAVCGNNSTIVFVENQPYDNLEYSIFTDGSSDGTIYQGNQFSLPVAHSYTIYARDISTGCTSLEGTSITVDPAPLFLPAPKVSVILPACGGNTGTVTITSPLGADYEYSNNNGSYQSGQTFTIPAGTPYSIIVHKISTGCASYAASGTMSPSWSPSQPVLYVNASATGLNNGTNWTDAYKSLQDALANSGGCVTQIWVAKGTYYPDDGGGKTHGDRNAAFAMRNNLAMYGGFAGTEASVNDRNLKVNKTILSGDIDQNDGAAFLNYENNSNNVINNVGLDNTAIIDGFVITAGYAGDGGGGMHNSHCSPSIANCIFVANEGNYGGAMMNIGSSPSVTNCIFLENEANVGCAMANGFDVDAVPGPVLTNCTFLSTCGGGNSGVISNNNGCTTLITNCIIWGNSGAIGGYADNITYSIVQGGYPGTGNLNIEPLFVDAANGDLHLQACSPAIDAGDDAANSNSTDLDINNRKFDAIAGASLIDMGAYEYQSNAISRWYKDNDGDTYGDPAVFTDACAAPTGYVANSTDCNDANGTVFPGAAEVCDGIDNDCDGNIDEGFTNTDHDALADCVDADDDNDGVLDVNDCAPLDATKWRTGNFYVDGDGDGYGAGSLVSLCYGATTPAGYSTVNGDCNNSNGNIKPGAAEICGNGIDDNCNGQIDENCGVCGNATAFSTTNITKNSATLNWVASVNPVQWQVQYKTTNVGSKWVDVPLLAGSVRTYNITGLKSNQGYNWHIRAKCGKTWTAYSNAIMFKTTLSSSTITNSLAENSFGVKLCPNPNKGQFVVALNMADKININAKIQLIDMTGKTVQMENAEINNGSLQKTINVSSSLTKGIYMVRIIVNDKVYKTQMIYEK